MAQEHVSLEDTIAMARRLAPEEREKLREALDQMGSAPDEGKEILFKRLLMEKGLISEIRRVPNTTPPCTDRHPVPLKGKPVSETIIEDRG